MDGAHNRSNSAISLIPTNIPHFLKVSSLASLSVALVIIGSLAMAGVIPSVGVYGGLGFYGAALVLFAGLIVYIFKKHNKYILQDTKLTLDEMKHYYEKLKPYQYFICSDTQGKKHIIVYAKTYPFSPPVMLDYNTKNKSEISRSFSGVIFKATHQNGASL